METLDIAVLGHVDHGKSTLLGRLLHDSGTLTSEQVVGLRAAAESRGVPFEWSFALDSLQAERDQAVTIGSARCRMVLAGREIRFRDAPGHVRFAAAAATAAAACVCGLIIVDAREGWSAPVERHVEAATLLGIGRWILVANKMDLAGFDARRFETVRVAATAALARIGAELVAAIPVCAVEGDNLVTRSARAGWYGGPTLAETLAKLRTGDADAGGPLRLPVQDIYRSGESRILAGRLAAGSLKAGDRLLFMPSDQIAHVAALVPEGTSGRNVAITIDRPVYVARGEVACAADRPAIGVTAFRARAVWLGGRVETASMRLRVRIGTGETAARATFAAPPQGPGEIAAVTLEMSGLLAVDPPGTPGGLHRGVLVENGRIVAGFTLDPQSLTAAATRRHELLGDTVQSVSAAERARLAGHRGGVVWLTGLSGAGKSTLAMGLQRKLFERGWHAYVLDGDNVRHGLNRDLGFSAADRAENIRRVGEVAALFADAGVICITAFISPYRADRAHARQAAGGSMREIYVDASLEVCERRDPKGLYVKARSGKLTGFTGIDAPYEDPVAPDLVLDTGNTPIDASIETLARFVIGEFGDG
jgi:bifunctional enzyme CysN/CysC